MSSVTSNTPPRLISEALTPLAGGFDTAAMAQGEPGLPAGFHWRDAELLVQDVLQSWKETGDCSHGSKEQYVRRHYWKLRLEDGRICTVYFERQPRKTGTAAKSPRWFLYTMEENN